MRSFELLVVALGAERSGNPRSTRTGKHRGLGRRVAYGVQPAGAAHGLGRIGDPQAPDALAKALEHGDARVRAESAAALGEIKTPRR